MKTVMIYPDPKSEKGIANYSINLLKKLPDVESITYEVGNPWTLFKQLPKILKYEKIHIQHEYNGLKMFGIPWYFLLTILGTIFDKQIFLTMHTVQSQTEKYSESKIRTYLRKALYRSLNRHINGTTKKIIAHAEFFKNILIKEYNIPKEKIKVISHGIMEDIKLKDKEQAKKELGLSGPIYLLIGTMVPDHGISTILEQAGKIGATILVVSNPEYGRENYIDLCKRIVEKNRFENYVRFDFKEIPDKLWWDYFSAADLILLPYVGGIGSGIFADGIAARKPMVTSNIKYFREIAEKYNCVELSRTDEDFPRVINEMMKPENYERVVRGCQKYFDENNLTVVAEKHKEVYNDNRTR